jgi:beta-galactosidase
MSNMYPGVNAVLQRGQSNDPKPYFMCEFAHARGNGMGNLKEYWDVVDANPRCIGGCIWDYVDQTIYQPSDGKKTPDGRDVISGYGGDFGDVPNSHIEACNGLVLSDRTPTAKLPEVKRVYQSVKFTSADPASGVVTLLNKNSFTTLADLTLSWSLTCDGVVEQSGQIPCPPIAALTSGDVRLPIKPVAARPGAMYTLNLSLRSDHATRWADAGHEIAAGQFGLPMVDPVAVTVDSMPPLTLKKEDGRVRISGKVFTAEFDPATGTLAGFKSATGPELIRKGPQLQVYRSPGDSDVWIMSEWKRFGLADLEHQLKAFAVQQMSSGTVRVTATHAWAGKNDLSVLEDVQYTVFGDGSIAVSSQMSCNRPELVLPRVGNTLTLPAGLENVTWFGRGPQENYPDRCAGADLGRYTSTVTKMFEPYVRPQTMGNRQETAWLKVTNADGHGLLVSMPRPGSFIALHFTEQDLTGKRHPNELTANAETILSIDSATLGLGSASCGPRTLPQYVIHAVPRLTRYTLRAIDAKTDVATLARTPAPVVAPVLITRGRDGMVTLSTPTAGSKMAYAIDDETTMKPYAGPFKLTSSGKVTADATLEGQIPEAGSQMTFGKLLDRAGWRVTASSEQPGEGKAEHAIDDDPQTFWHTQYTGTEARPPHELTLDLGKKEAINAVTLLPRSDDPNGRAREYELQISLDGHDWTVAASGRFGGGIGKETIPLKPETATRYVRYIIKSTANGRPFGSLAEIDVVAAGQ